jgi:spore maturation protein CgeB
VQSGVVEAAEEHRPDLVVNLDHRVVPDTVRALRRTTGSPVVFWFPDHAGNLGREDHVLAGYDGLFFKDSRVAERYRRNLGLPAHFLPEACNPRWHTAVGELGEPQDEPEVLVAGNVYATRFALLRELRRRGVRVRIFGPPWARWLPEDADLESAWERRQIHREEKARQFRAAPVVLNSMMTQEGDGLNCRLFEATGCGAIVLTEHRDRLPELYEVGTEVRAYRSVDELVEQARELSAMPAAERAAMSGAALARAHGEHTYAHRFATITAAVGRG